MAEKYAKEHNLSQNWVDNVGVSNVKIAYQLEHHKKDLTSNVSDTSSVSDTPSQNHENKKTALIVGSIVGLNIFIHNSVKIHTRKKVQHNERI